MGSHSVTCVCACYSHKLQLEKQEIKKKQRKKIHTTYQRAQRVKILRDLHHRQHTATLTTRISFSLSRHPTRTDRLRVRTSAPVLGLGLDPRKDVCNGIFAHLQIPTAHLVSDRPSCRVSIIVRCFCSTTSERQSDSLS